MPIPQVGDMFWGGVYDWEVIEVKGQEIDTEGRCYYRCVIRWTGYTNNETPSVDFNPTPYNWPTWCDMSVLTYTAMCPQPCYDSDCACIYSGVES